MEGNVTAPLPTELSAKAKGKRRMADLTAEEQAEAMLRCAAPASEPPAPATPQRPPPDCSDDAAIAALYQAQYDQLYPTFV